MKKIIVIIIMLIILSGCVNNQETIESGKENNRTITSTKEVNELLKENEDTKELIEDSSINTEWETKDKFVPKPISNTKLNTYKLCEGEEFEVEIIELDAAKDGPTIYIVAGQHGDEIAGYEAINQLKNMEIISGKVYILSPANILGASREIKERYIVNKEDLNRSYPGTLEGTDSEKLARAIYEDIIDKNPILVLDHHEARRIETNYDFLGSSLIYTTLEGIDKLFLDMHQATQENKLASEPYNFYSPGPIGSLNNVISTNLGIPVITVETFRGYQLERRIEDHLAIAGYVLRYYNFVEY